MIVILLCVFTDIVVFANLDDCNFVVRFYGYCSFRQNPEKRTTKLQSPRLAKTTISGKTHNKITII
jgi:hypothetical protein